MQAMFCQIKCGADVVNRAADNGNTPLHAAGNVGDAKMVATLLNVDGIAIDAKNPQCENATPLHLAVMHGEWIILVLALFSVPRNLLSERACVGLSGPILTVKSVPSVRSKQPSTSCSSKCVAAKFSAQSTLVCVCGFGHVSVKTTGFDAKGLRASKMGARCTLVLTE